MLESEFIAIEQFMGMRDSLDEEDLEIEQADDKQPKRTKLKEVNLKKTGVKFYGLLWMI